MLLLLLLGCPEPEDTADTDPAVACDESAPGTICTWAGQAQAGFNGEIQPVDQNDVTNGKLDQHGFRGPSTPLRNTAGASIGSGPLKPHRSLNDPKALLIHEPSFSRGTVPLDSSNAYVSLYHWLSGKLCPRTAAAVSASFTIPSAR